MTRNTLQLDGTWDFQFVGDDTAATLGSITEWRQATVPGPWQAQFDDLRMSAGTAWYRRRFAVAADWVGAPVFLRFIAVMYHAQVWVNGRLAGEHEGGYLPFEFDIGPLLVAGENELAVRVIAPTDDPEAYPDFPFAETPFGKQSWYGPLSGIWQSVSLEKRAAVHVRHIRILPDLASGRVAVAATLGAPAAARQELVFTILDPSGAVAAQSELALIEGQTVAEQTLTVRLPKAWSPDEPNLYTLSVVVLDDSGKLDRLADSFGFRTIEARDGRIWLNGSPLILRAALDQDYYPDGICTAPSLAFLEDQLVKAKQLGLNMLRCHIKVPDPRYYEVADRLGMLIWTELPNGGRVTEKSRARAEATLRGIVERDGNHPSIVIWTIINENWGTDLVHNPEHRAWLKRTFAWLKAYDPTRLVTDNSPLAPSFHVKSDIEDMHFYAAIPDHRRNWDAFLNGFTERAGWTFCPPAEAERTGQEPLLCSEFGNWGLPFPKDLRGPDGKEPWWFETGHDWGEGIMYAHGVENRFRDWSLDRAFGSFDAFIEAAQWQQYYAFKYQIEAMRRKPQMAGYVITELTDCHWESNGLMDMRRNTRVFHDRFAEFNAETVVVAEWQRTAYWAGETVELGVAVAHGGGRTLEGAQVAVELAGERQALAVPAVEASRVADLGTVALAAPAEAGGVVQVELTLRDAAGREINRNHLPLAVYPRRAAPAAGVPALHSPEPVIAQRLQALGYRVTEDRAEAAASVVTHLDHDMQAYVREGGHLLFLCDHVTSLYPYFPHWQQVKVTSRDSTLWAGDWASTFSWVKRKGPFARLAGGPLVDQSFDRVIPKHIIGGVNLLDFQSRVHAGLVIGWVHKPVATILERNYGRGRFVTSTFRLLNDKPGVDPTATLMLDGLIELTLQGHAAKVAAQPAEAGLVR